MRREKRIPNANNPWSGGGVARGTVPLFVVVVVVTGRSGSCLLLCRCGVWTRNHKKWKTNDHNK